MELEKSYSLKAPIHQATLKQLGCLQLVASKFASNHQATWLLAISYTLTFVNE